MRPFLFAIAFVLAADFGAAFRQRPTVQHLESQACGRASNESLTIPSNQVEIVFVRHGVSLNNLFREKMGRNLKDMLKLKAKSKRYTWKSSSTSRFKAGYAKVCNEEKICGPYIGDGELSDLRWEIHHKSQDCLLHPDGEDDAIKKGILLSTVLPRDSISGFFTSPLRRTMQTLLSGFREFIDEASPVEVMPWLHERFKSPSDWAYPGGITAKFLEVYTRSTSVPKAKIDEMKEQLEKLGDWTVKRGKTHGFTGPGLTESLPVCDRPDITASQAYLLAGEDNNEPVDFEDMLEIAISDDGRESFEQDPSELDDDEDNADEPDEVDCGPSGKSMAYYPGKWKKSSPGKEKKLSLKHRMDVVRRWLKTLEQGKRYVIVSHGGVGTSLFGSYAEKKGLKGKLANFGIITARFNPTEDYAEHPDKFFIDGEVKTGAERWGCEHLAGWRA